MARTLLINAVDRTALMRLFADNNGSPGGVFQETAFRGEVGTGNVLLDDTTTFTVPGMKAVSLDESAASQTRIWTGYVDIRRIRRGPFKAGTDRQWSVDLEDVNALLDDQILLGADGANRPEETDYQRMTWLLGTSALGGATAGSTVPSGSNVDMDAGDYRGEHPRKVLEDCMQKSGKNGFLYRTTALFLFYAPTSGTTYSSTSKISDDPADVDSSTTWAPIIEGDTLTRDSSRVFSAVRLRYKGGDVYVRNATTATNYRTHESTTTNMRAKTRTKAIAQAQKWLDKADVETDILPDISIEVPAANVNDIRAGQRVQLKIRHAGITSFTYYRVRSRTITPVNDVTYRLRLTFLDDVRVTQFQVAGTSADEEASALTLRERVVDVALAGTNLVLNSSAENAGDWTAGSWTVGYASSLPFHGTKTFRAAPSAATVSQLRSSAFISVDRLQDYWISVYSLMSAYTSGTGQLKVLEYNSSDTLLATTIFDTVTAVEGAWTRRGVRFGAVAGEDVTAFQATTTKVKIAADSTATVTFTWELDAWQVERSSNVTYYNVYSQELLDASVTAAKLAAGAIADMTAFAAGIHPPRVVAALPTLPDAAYPQGDLVVLTSDNKLYRSTGSAWTAAVPTVDLTGTITTAQIADAALTTAKFAAGIRPVGIVAALPTLPDALYPVGATVVLTTDGKLYRNVSDAWSKATDGADIAADTITAGQIAAGAISTSELAALAVTAAKIAVGTITANEIAALTITAAVIATDAITTAKIAANAVTAAEILANTITAGQIAAAAIGADQIAANAIRASHLLVGGRSPILSNADFEGNSAGLTGTTPGWTGENSVFGTGTSVNYYSGTTYGVQQGLGMVQIAYASGAAAPGLASDKFAVTAGEVVSLSALCTGSGAYTGIAIRWYTQADAYISISYVSNVIPTGSWVRYGGTVTAPANAFFGRVLLNANSAFGTLAYDDVDVALRSDLVNAAGSVVINSAGVAILNGKLLVYNDGGSTVVVDGTKEIMQIVYSGSVLLPKADKKGDVFKSAIIATGLAYDPATMFFVKLPDPDGQTGDWSQQCPYYKINVAGQIVARWGGRARVVNGNQTQVQGFQMTTNPADPLPARSMRYYILNKTSL